MAIGENIELELGVQTRSGGAPEQKLFGRYTLKRVLGRGGMGIVWLAADDELKRNVAMKFLPDMLIRDRQAVEDLKHETRRSLDLTHHHIVRIYDFTQDDACAAIIMEYVDGETMSSMKTQQPGGCFGVSVIAPWIGHFCMALDYAHSQARVIHRDLKPANLMINGRGDLKVTDFGISRSMSDSMTRVSVSNTAGTLAYMSPEQALGAPPTPGDDVYAFGATVFDLLTGRPPFFRGNLQVQLETVIPPPMMERRAELGNNAEPIPALWEEVIATCLAKRPQDRPQTLGEVASMLGVGGPSSTATRAFFGGVAGGFPGTHSTNATQLGTSATLARTLLPEEIATRADGSSPGTSPGTARAVPPASQAKGVARATSLNDIIPGYDAASAPARPTNRTAPVQPPATARPATQPVRPAAPATQPPASQPAQPSTAGPPAPGPASEPPSVVVPELPPLAPEPVVTPEALIAEAQPAEMEVVDDEMPPIMEEAEIVELDPEPEPEAEIALAPRVELEPEPIQEEVTKRRVEPAYELVPAAPEAKSAPIEPSEPPATARNKIPAVVPPVAKSVSPQATEQPYQTSTGYERGAPISSPGKSKLGLFAGIVVACLAIGIAAWMGTHGRTDAVPKPGVNKPVVVETPAAEATKIAAAANALFDSGDSQGAEAKAKEAQAKDPSNQQAIELLAKIDTANAQAKRLEEKAADMERAAQEKETRENQATKTAVATAEAFLKDGKLDDADEAVSPGKIPSSHALDAAVAGIRGKIKDARDREKREKMFAAANAQREMDDQAAREQTAREQASRVKEDADRKARSAANSGSSKKNQTSSADRAREKSRVAEREREKKGNDDAAAAAAEKRRKQPEAAEAQSSRPPAEKDSGPKRTQSPFGGAPGNG